MTESKPPVLASWMLEHLLWGGRNEALAGDLLEEFQRGRSVAWYWRQVFGAILASFSSEVRADWVMVWTIAFTVAWVYGLYAIPFLASQLPLPLAVGIRPVHYLSAHGYYGTPVWYAFSYAFRFVLPFLFHVAVPLGLYLAGARNMNFWAVARGLGAGIVATLGLRLIHFQPALDFLSMHGFAMYWTQLWKWFEVVTRILPLLAAMWAAQAGRKRSMPAAILE
jgi:hypothetical protein